MKLHHLKSKLTIAALVLVGLMSSAKTPTLVSSDKAARDRWVDSVYNSLSLRQRVAQLVFAQIHPTKDKESKSLVQRMATKAEVGGLIFEPGTLNEIADFINLAQDYSKVPMLMTIDAEWGLSMRINGMPRFPQNMALGSLSNERLLYNYGREMARECRELGIQVNFAPVADVNINPANPAIGYRSFGQDPVRVARAVAAYSKGLEDGGVQAVAKHFPGHGDTSTDSHKELPTVNHSLSQLQSTDLVPFKEFIENGCSGIMTAHLNVPALDATGTPASLSKKISTDLLRGEMGFEGLIYTDALSMEGANTAGSNAVKALLAGADVLLAPLDPNAEINALIGAVKSGKIPESVVEDRCKRVLTYKYALGLNHRDRVKVKGLESRICSEEADATGQALADAAITLLRNKGNLLPLRLSTKPVIAIAMIGKFDDDAFTDLASRYAKIDVVESHNGIFSKADLNTLRKADVRVAVIGDDSQQSRNALSSLNGMGNSVYVFLMNPYKMNKFHASIPSASALILAGDNTVNTRRAAAKALFGGIEISGTLPVNLPRIAPMGSGIHLQKTRLGFTSPRAEGLKPWLTDSIDSIVGHALAVNGIPGCQVLIAKGGNIVLDKCYGNLTEGGAPVTPLTRYDLASVSKTIGTLPGIMKAVDLGLLDLHTAASKYVPGLLVDPAKSDFTIEDLLYHETGMQPSLNVFNMMMDPATYSGQLIASKKDADHLNQFQKGAWGHKDARLRTDILSTERTDVYCNPIAEGIWGSKETYDTVMARIYSEPVRKNRNFCYSCLNFCLLMDAEQRVTGKPHDEWLATNFTAPLGAYTMTYRPALADDKYPSAPTENDSFMRRQVVDNYVHDELAAFSGGLQGNAGLFSNADDIAKMCQMWLNGGEYGGERLLSEETCRLFTTSKTPRSRRGLGFDKPDTVNFDNSPTCDEALPEVYGHTGFTGTCFWIDPVNEVIFIFLSNRVNPTRNNTAFSSLNLRPELFRQVYNAL